MGENLSINSVLNVNQINIPLPLEAVEIGVTCYWCVDTR